MRPQYSITLQPASEPISYDSASDHLRVDSAQDIAYIEGLISVAREYVESVTGRATVETSFKLVCNSWQSLFQTGENSLTYLIPIFRTPLISVESVKYYAPDASSLTTMSESDYRVITTTEPGMIQVTGEIPSVEDRPDAIQIEFTAGHESATDIPATLCHATKMLVAHLYENRLPVAFASCNEIPYTMRALIENNKIGGWTA